MPPLTDKQAAFVREYLIDLNATAAALRAGYSKKTARFIGSENLTKPNIRLEIKNLIEQRSKDTAIDSAWVLRNLSEMFTADIGDILEDDGSFKAISSMPEVWRKMIVSIDMEEGKGGVKIRKMRYVDKLRIIENIGKHIDVGAFQERVRVEGGDLVNQIMEARKRAK